MGYSVVTSVKYSRLDLYGRLNLYRLLFPIKTFSPFN